MVNYTPNLESKEDNQFELAINTIMDKKFVWFEATSSIDDAIDKILRSGVTGAPVLDKEGILVGYLSQKDCLKFATQVRYLNDLPRHVEDYMSQELHSFKDSTPILKAVQSFIDMWYHSYPVTNDQGKVIGVLNRTSILKFIKDQEQTSWSLKSAS